MITNLDLSKILLETDAPYQPRKGYIQNVPENLPVLASAMAAILNMSETEICAVLSKISHSIHLFSPCIFLICYKYIPLIK